MLAVNCRAPVLLMRAAARPACARARARRVVNVSPVCGYGGGPFAFAYWRPRPRSTARPSARPSSSSRTACASTRSRWAGRSPTARTRASAPRSARAHARRRGRGRARSGGCCGPTTLAATIGHLLARGDDDHRRDRRRVPHRLHERRRCRDDRLTGCDDYRDYSRSLGNEAVRRSQGRVRGRSAVCDQMAAAV